MVLAVIKRSGRTALCNVCEQPIYEGTAWGEPQWWHESEPKHAIEPMYGSIH